MVGIGLLLLAAYSALGFWLVPWLAQREARSFITQQLHREGGIGALRFNPFTLRLEASDLRLAEADGSPLLSVGSLAVQLRWKSIASRAWQFGPIRIGQPAVHLRVAPDGRFNIAELLASLPQSAPSPGPAAIPRLLIERLTVEEGLVQLQDRQAGYENTISPLSFELDEFSTFAEGTDTHTLSAQSRHGGRLLWRGHASLAPMRASGELVVENASLAELGVYLKPRVVGLEKIEGRVALALPYTVTYSQGRLQARLERARVGVQGLAVGWQGLQASVADTEFSLSADASQAGAGDFELRTGEGTLALTDVRLAKTGLAPLTLTRVKAQGGQLDLAQRKAGLAQLSIEGLDLDLQREPDGRLNLLRWLPVTAATAARQPALPAASAPWAVQVERIDLGRSRLAFSDAATGVKLRLAAIDASVQGAGTDLSRTLRFDAAVQVQEGGKLSAQGEVVPASGAVKAQVQVAGLALKPVEPLLAQFVRLRIAGGAVNARGKVSTGAGVAKSPALLYEGSLEVAGLSLREADGALFAGWKSLAAPQLALALSPNRLEIPELRIASADAKLIIEDDRSLNATRLLVPRDARAAVAVPAAASASSASPASPGDAFPVRIRRFRVADSRLEFTDLSLRPQFSARIHELAGAVNGISSSGTARSQVALEGRVDEFGLARIRGELNPFVPRYNTDLNFSFRNVDMVPASPYSMKFAGYRIASGRISLDLDYKVREGKLEGDNRVVIEKLTLGERVDSPDALKIPLQLALALLTDVDGRIDLGLPVSGDLDDPQFSYGAIIWKAIGNVLTKVVTAPFRALGSLLGISGDKLDAIVFDPGSSRMLPPEREKLGQVAQALAKRGNLTLEVPASYSPESDGGALREEALRRELLARAGVKLEAGEAPGPLDLGDRKMRSAMRELYARRFGDAELEKAKKAAEAGAGAGTPGTTTASSTPASTASAAPAPVPLWQRAANLAQGEPQVADARGFYTGLHERLSREQSIAADALASLGKARAVAVTAALAQAGVDATRASSAAPAPVEAQVGKPVSLKLGLSAR